jgi:DNA-binding transcriptional ArsR family regulator
MRHTEAPDAFDAIADPARRAILEVLGRGEADVPAIVRGTKLPVALVARHLRVLRECDLVRVRSEGRSRTYRINVPAMRGVHQWITRFPRLWGHSFDPSGDGQEQEPGDRD